MDLIGPPAGGGAVLDSMLLSLVIQQPSFSKLDEKIFKLIVYYLRHVGIVVCCSALIQVKKGAKKSGKND